jgi:hypothetical protein
MKDSFSGEQVRRCAINGTWKENFLWKLKHAVIRIFCFGRRFNIVFINISVTIVILVFSATTV